MSIIHRR